MRVVLLLAYFFVRCRANDLFSVYLPMAGAQVVAPKNVLLIQTDINL